MRAHLRFLAIASVGILAHTGGVAQTASEVVPKELPVLRKDRFLMIPNLEASGRLPKVDLSGFPRPDASQIEPVRSASLAKLAGSGAVPRFEEFKVSIDDDRNLAKARYELWRRSLVPAPILLDQLRRTAEPSDLRWGFKPEVSGPMREFMKKQSHPLLINPAAPGLNPLNPGIGGGSVGASVPTVILDVNNLWNGRLNEHFNPEGFLEVVALVNDSNAGKPCTGTLVGPDLVLTAAHCVAEGDAVTVVVHYKDANQRRRCEAAIGRKEYIRCTRLDLQTIEKARVKRHPQYKPGNRDNDIALLALPAPFSDRRFARVNVASFPAEITLAGYGRTDLPKAVNDLNHQNYLIEVGGYKGRAVPSGTVVSWYVSGRGGTQSGACEGDSGGPVYAGRWRGYEAQPKSPEIVGLVQGGIQSCSDYDSHQTSVADESIKSWLCEELVRHGAPGCITAVSSLQAEAGERVSLAR